LASASNLEVGVLNIGCVLFHNLKNLDRSERNAPRSFSPDCIDLALI